jgi:hypothetical protein
LGGVSTLATKIKEDHASTPIDLGDEPLWFNRFVEGKWPFEGELLLAVEEVLHVQTHLRILEELGNHRPEQVDGGEAGERPDEFTLATRARSDRLGIGAMSIAVE